MKSALAILAIAWTSLIWSTNITNAARIQVSVTANQHPAAPLTDGKDGDCKSNKDCPKDKPICKHLILGNGGRCYAADDIALHHCCQLDCVDDSDCCEIAPNCIVEKDHKYCNHDCEARACETDDDCCEKAPICQFFGEGRPHICRKVEGTFPKETCFSRKNGIGSYIN